MLDYPTWRDRISYGWRLGVKLGQSDAARTSVWQWSDYRHTIWRRKWWWACSSVYHQQEGSINNPCTRAIYWTFLFTELIWVIVRRHAQTVHRPSSEWVVFSFPSLSDILMPQEFCSAMPQRDHVLEFESHSILYINIQYHPVSLSYWKWGCLP